jgi:hypothetical protein
MALPVTLRQFCRLYTNFPLAYWSSSAIRLLPVQSSTMYQGLTLVHVRAQLEQLQDTFRVKMGYTVDRRTQVALKSERVQAPAVYDTSVLPWVTPSGVKTICGLKEDTASLLAVKRMVPLLTAEVMVYVRMCPSASDGGSSVVVTDSVYTAT